MRPRRPDVFTRILWHFTFDKDFRYALRLSDPVMYQRLEEHKLTTVRKGRNDNE